MVEQPCDFSGHFWVDAGGGLSICAQCQKETFDPVPLVNPVEDGEG